MRKEIIEYTNAITGGELLEDMAKIVETLEEFEYVMEVLRRKNERLHGDRYGNERA